MKTVILASQSPRRRELLEKCSIPFQVDAADIDETIDNNNDLADEIKKLAERKAQEVFKRHLDDIVIAADTIVTIDHEVLGKPKNDDDAKRMLRRLSDRTHQVITGLCIMSADKKYSVFSISEVTFAKMDEKEIDAYIATGETRDKAGAYAIQGYGSRYITGIRGDFYSIMGLPVSIVYQQLKHIEQY